ncbi:hypothetical protein [Grimontia sp. NTOU-MAR1]|uniref:hypothetical protein n=1 Tax=Grimontia sp. NTOU-MAR1 TaxID=3111011 RepID=UPI002DBE0323|nr:hypothetical protein [Grimontia sp. NTOU-MAR1]WRW00908.1 hypothetical protein VP504_20910 [Grimontia sp. NTOU-MAR1]
METQYSDLYWGARYHLKQDPDGNFYLIGMQQKIWQVFGFIALVPMSASIVMAFVSWMEGDNQMYFFLIAAAFLLLISLILMRRTERFVFSSDRVSHLLGWGKAPPEKASWSIHDCNVKVTPIVQHKSGCWLQLNANGHSMTRNSIGKFDQTAEMALFLSHQTGIEAIDNVTAWPESRSLEITLSGKLRHVKPLRVEGAEYQVEGSIWRLLWVFPFTLTLGALLFVFNWIQG